MKAIIGKILPATNTKPQRLKISAEGVKPKLLGYARDSIPMELEQYARDLGWLKDGAHMAHGQLPSGEFVACFIEA